MSSQGGGRVLTPCTLPLDLPLIANRLNVSATQETPLETLFAEHSTLLFVTDFQDWSLFISNEDFLDFVNKVESRYYWVLSYM